MKRALRRSSTVEHVEPPPLEPAPLDRRLGALGVDLLVIAPFFLAYLIGFAALTGFEPILDPRLVLIEAIPIAAGWLAYFTYFEGTKGATPGKRRFALAVVDSATGELIGWRRGLRRKGVFYLSMAAWPTFAYVFYDRRNRALHDKAVHSLVVLRRAGRAARTDLVGSGAEEGTAWRA